MPLPRTVGRPRAVAALCAGLVVSLATPARAADDPFAVHRRVPDEKPDGVCGHPRGIALYAFPNRPALGGMVRVVAVADRALEGEVSIEHPSGKRDGSAARHYGGGPHWWVAETFASEYGTYRVRFASPGLHDACAGVVVAGEGPAEPLRPSATLWPVERVWDRDMENLYSAWIEKLFDAALDETPTWKSLHDVTRDPARNFLYDSLGLGEDSEDGIALEPDCADLPYFLRGYFAWKLRLPFVYSKCYSTTPGGTPVCAETFSNLGEATPGKETLAVMQRFFSRDIAWTAHSATGRTAAADERTDVYPVRIGSDTLRPGTVYIDPFGHVLIVAKRVAQTADASGILFAVDAQPDGTVARKRYWRGNFLFALEEGAGSPGFKRFRPVVPDGAGGLRMLTNDEIGADPAYGDWSTEQYEGGVDGFYDKVDAVLSPEKRPAERVLGEVVDSLEKQVLSRVASVAGGERYVTQKQTVVAMPPGAAIFQTTGAWEDYATPGRDLGILVAIDIVRDFPAYVLRQKSRFVLPAGLTGLRLERSLEDMLARELAARSFEYERSDGSRWRLTLAELIERAEAMEMAYNPNDCVEVRWGARRDSEEASTCRRRAPEEQHRQMRQARDWFRTRTRPAT